MTMYKHIQGAEELQKRLLELPAKIEKNIMRGALRAGAKVILDQAISLVPVKSGKLKSTLRIKTNSRRGLVTATIVAGDAKKGVYYANMVDKGTKAHLIVAKKGGALRIGSIFAKSIHHPGSKAEPFMEPALKSGADGAIKAIAEYIEKRLDQSVK